MHATERHNRADRRRLRTRAALLAAAREVFGSKGVEAATIQDITDTADVAKGSFYNHFDDADAILRAVVEETLAALGLNLEALTAPLRDDAARVIAVSLRHTLRACTEDPTIGWFVLRAGDLLKASDIALGAHGRRDIEIGIQSGRFRCDDVDLISTMIAGATLAIVRRRLKGDLPDDAEGRFVAHVLTLLGVPRDEAMTIANEELPAVETPADVTPSPARRAG